jgi:hypothetical protein
MENEYQDGTLKQLLRCQPLVDQHTSMWAWHLAVHLRACLAPP